MDPCEKDPDFTSFRAYPCISVQNGEVTIHQKMVSWDQRIPRRSVRNTRGRVKTFTATYLEQWDSNVGAWVTMKNDVGCRYKEMAGRTDRSEEHTSELQSP